MDEIIDYMQEIDAADSIVVGSNNKIKIWGSSSSFYGNKWELKIRYNMRDSQALGFVGIPRYTERKSAEDLLFDYESASGTLIRRAGLVSFKEERLEEHRKIIKSKYGEKGLKVYDSINKFDTVDELREKAGLDEKKMLDVIRFMRRNYFIELEEKQTNNVKLNMVYTKNYVSGTEVDYVAGKFKAFDGEYRFKKITPNGITGEMVEEAISETYGDKGLKVYNMLDGEKGCEEIRKEIGLSVVDMKDLMDFLYELQLVNKSIIKKT